MKTAKFTTTGQVLGTPQYMAPEQLTGQSVDGRADLFALGMILYWLLTGENPFAGESMATLTFKIVYSEPLPPTKLDPGLGEDTDYVINRALAKDPARRYQRGREYDDDVDDLLGGRPARSRSVLRTPTPAPVGAARRLGLLVPSPEPKTEPLRTSPLATLSIFDRLWARLLGPDALRIGVPSALVLLLVLSLSTWWVVGRSNQPPVPDAVTSPYQTVASTATLRIRGEHPFNEATLYAYANDKLIRRTRLQKKGADGKFTLNAAVVPGRHTVRIRIEEAGKGFDQSSALDGQFAVGQTRTLEVDFERQVKFLGPRRFVLRWLD